MAGSIVPGSGRGSQRSSHSRHRILTPRQASQSSTRNGFYWWEIDLTYYGLKVLSWLGLIWDLREVPAHVLEAGRRHLPVEA